jgi:hypothetical protein
MSKVGDSISQGFWSFLTHLCRVFADFIGQVLIKLGDAIIHVMDHYGVGGASAK